MVLNPLTKNIKIKLIELQDFIDENYERSNLLFKFQQKKIFA